MENYELQKTIEELNEKAGIPGNEERCLELARALTAHYTGKDRVKDENQLEIPFEEN